MSLTIQRPGASRHQTLAHHLSHQLYGLPLRMVVSTYKFSPWPACSLICLITQDKFCYCYLRDWDSNICLIKINLLKPLLLEPAVGSWGSQSLTRCLRKRHRGKRHGWWIWTPPLSFVYLQGLKDPPSTVCMISGRSDRLSLFQLSVIIFMLLQFITHSLFRFLFPAGVKCIKLILVPLNCLQYI